MNKLFKSILFSALAFALAGQEVLAVTSIQAGASGAFNNPGYTPVSIVTLPAQSLTSGGYLNTGAQNIYFPTVGNSTLALQFYGGSTPCAGLNATVLGSVDGGATYQQLNVYPYPALGTAAPTILASGGPILYSTGLGGISKVNIQGFSNIEVSISALTGTTCQFKATMVGSTFNAVAY